MRKSVKLTIDTLLANGCRIELHMFAGDHKDLGDIEIIDSILIDDGRVESERGSEVIQLLLIDGAHPVSSWGVSDSDIVEIIIECSAEVVKEFTSFEKTAH